MIWSQRWMDVLFLHWRVPETLLQSALPRGVEIDLYEGEAWVSCVLFRLMVRPRWLPRLPGLSNLVEMNLRTYVRSEGCAAITFLSVLADNPIAIWAARLLTPLPYQRSRIEYRQTTSRDYSFELAGIADARDSLSLDFHPTGAATIAEPGSLDAWLLERYHLLAFRDDEHPVQAAVDHAPWSFRRVDLDLRANSLGQSLGLSLDNPPDLAHFSEGVAVRFNPFLPCDYRQREDRRPRSERQRVGLST